ncbi:trypsin-like serine protease [Streptomyces sp. NPDC001139]
MDRRRLVLVRSGDEDGVRRLGTGYLIAPRLVLTARHVVEETAGTCWSRLEARVGHPQDVVRSCRASVCWTHSGGRDVALLLLDHPVDVPGNVRWGSPTGNRPVPYDALGYPLATTAGGQHSVEHLRGELPPQAGGKDAMDRYVLDQGPAPVVRADGEQAWSGASGSAVFCQDHLVGVVIHDDAAFENRRLHACPARSFTDDPAFAELLTRYGDGPPKLVGISVSRPGAEPVRASLERYLHSALRAAAEHPYPGVVDPARMPALSDIYVRQQVVQHTLPLKDGEKGAGLGAEGLLVSAPPQPADEVLTGDGVCLVVAGPGGGKSSLLRTRLAHGIGDLMGNSVEAAARVPVLVPAAALDGAPLSRALAETVNAQLRPYGLTVPLPDDFFDAPPDPGGRWLVLVDGLDEITSPDGRKDVLKTVTHAGDRYAFIVATRPVPEAELGILGPQVPRYHLEPFGPDELERIACSWFRALDVPEPEETAGRFAGAMESAGLTELARVPLTMSMLCQLHALAPDRLPPRGRGDIYRQFVEALHERRHTAGSSGAVRQARAAMEQYGSDAETRAERTVQNLRKVLAYLAHELLTTGAEDRHVVDIVTEHEYAERPEAVPEKRWRDFLETALCGSGLLTRSADDLVFVHHTFAEYFAALHVVSDEKRHRDIFRKDLIRWAFYIPRLSYAPAMRPRVWLRRYWAAPFGDSFTGFVLDITPDNHPAKRKLLDRMASRRAGLRGFRFVAEQSRLGTSLPEAVTARVMDLIVRTARDRRVDDYFRLATARVMADFGTAKCAELFRELARDPDWDGYYRFNTAMELAELAPTGIREFFRDLARDASLEGMYRIQALWVLHESDPTDASELCRELAKDTTLGVTDRRQALWVLNESDPTGASELCRELAKDTALHGRDRIQAVRMLTELDPARVPELCRALTEDTTLKPLDHRNLKALAAEREPTDGTGTADPLKDSLLLDALKVATKIERPRAVQRLDSLAHDTAQEDFTRVRAGWQLAELDPGKGLELLRDFAQDRGMDSFSRVAAPIGFMSSHPEDAAEVFEELARENGLYASGRLESARRVTGLNRQRGGALLRELRGDKTLGIIHRVRSAALLLALKLGRDLD